MRNDPFFRMPLFFKLWFAFVASLALTVVGFTIYSVATDSGMIGRALAEVVNGYQEASK